MSTKIKCVVVGDGAVGKNCLIKKYINDVFPSEMKCDTPFADYTVALKVDDECVNLTVSYSAGQEDYDRWRHEMIYPHTDVFLICLSLKSSTTWSNVRHKVWTLERNVRGYKAAIYHQWNPDVSKPYPNTPIVLVGTKLDLRDESNVIKNIEKVKESEEKGRASITTKQGEKLKKEIGAKKYVECSALTGQGVDQVFEEVVKVALHSKTNKTPTEIIKFYEK